VTLPANLNRLSGLLLDFNRLSSLALPAGLTNLGRLTINGNQLTNLVLPSDMMSLAFLDVRGNQLTRLTLPQGVTKLTALFVDGNPLTAFVLSEPLAATNLAATVATLQGQGVNVFTYPLAVQLIRIKQPIGAFQFTIAGPPGAYAVDASPDLVNWIELSVSTNTLGKFVFTDGTAHLSPRKFYRARTAP
jgi:Leucine-rich repeat (LRR) protein